MIKNLLHQNQTSRLMAGLLLIKKKDLKKSGEKMDWLTVERFKKMIKTPAVIYFGDLCRS